MNTHSELSATPNTSVHSQNQLAFSSPPGLCVQVPAHTRDLRRALKYGKAKTPPKWRTQEWHLSDAAQTPSQPAQIHMQGRASCCSACETHAARSSRACEPASSRLLGTQIKPPDWPSEAPMAPRMASPGAGLNLSSWCCIGRHQSPAELLRRLLAAIPAC